MSRFSKILALLVMAAVSVSSLGTRSLRWHAPSPEQPAGCHGHGTKAPSPSPASSQCCLTGHDTAIPQASRFADLVPDSFQAELVVEPPIRVLVFSGWGSLVASSGDPPDAIPLRI